MDQQKPPSWKVPARLRSNAKSLRKNSTNAERVIWSQLRDHRLNGFSFRRQVPVGSYIADFVCHAAHLIIELDGGQHYEKKALKPTLNVIGIWSPKAFAFFASATATS